MNDFIAAGCCKCFFSGEGKLFGKSFPSPEPPSFQKLSEKGKKNLLALDISGKTMYTDTVIAQ